MAAGLATRPQFLVTLADHTQAGVRHTPLRVRYFAADVAVRRFLQQLDAQCLNQRTGERRRVSWLLAYRDDFRRIVAYRPNAGLADFLKGCSPDSSSFLVAVWLLGRCATPQATYLLERVPADGTPQARKHFARALRRVECWQRLRCLAADYPDDEELAALVSESPGDSFGVRLSRFAVHVDRSHEAEAAVASQMPLWFRDLDWRRTEPKRPAWIRVILERIRQWVRGE